jgi:hypothetical protein
MVDNVALLGDNQVPVKKFYEQLKSMLGRLGMQSEHLLHRNAYLKTPYRSRASHTRRGQIVSEAIRAPQLSMSTAGRTRSTASTSPTQASFRASAP